MYMTFESVRGENLERGLESRIVSFDVVPHCRGQRYQGPSHWVWLLLTLLCCCLAGHFLQWLANIGSSCSPTLKSVCGKPREPDNRPFRSTSSPHSLQLSRLGNVDVSLLERCLRVVCTGFNGVGT